MTIFSNIIRYYSMDLLDNSFFGIAVFLFITFVPFLFVLALIAAAIRWLWYHAKD